MPTTAESVKMAERLWDLANLVTGFAVVQTLAMTYGMLKGDLGISSRKHHVIVYAGTIVFACLYAAAIVWCGEKGRVLDATNSDVWTWVTRGRITAVVVFSLVAMGATYSHRQ